MSPLRTLYGPPRVDRPRALPSVTLRCAIAGLHCGSADLAELPLRRARTAAPSGKRIPCVRVNMDTAAAAAATRADGRVPSGLPERREAVPERERGREC